MINEKATDRELEAFIREPVNGAVITPNHDLAVSMAKELLELRGQVTAMQELVAIKEAAVKLVRCKGRYHSEQNYRALAMLLGVTTPDLDPGADLAPGWQALPIAPTIDMARALGVAWESPPFPKKYQDMLKISPDYDGQPLPVFTHFEGQDE